MILLFGTFNKLVRKKMLCSCRANKMTKLILTAELNKSHLVCLQLMKSLDLFSTLDHNHFLSLLDLHHWIIRGHWSLQGSEHLPHLVFTQHWQEEQDPAQCKRSCSSSSGVEHCTIQPNDWVPI